MMSRWWGKDEDKVSCKDEVKRGVSLTVKRKKVLVLLLHYLAKVRVFLA